LKKNTAGADAALTANKVNLFISALAKKNNNKEDTRPNAADYGGHPAPDGACPTQPYKCGQNVKVNVFISASAKTAKSKPHLF
jgi:hypothetical protein